MPKRKVTLSIESKVYDDFQKYCQDNAIMLSKKIEIFMKQISKSRKSFVLLFVFSILSFLALAQGLQFSDMTQANFNNGTYNNTVYNTNGVILSANNLTGSYASRVFDAGSASRLDNLSLNGLSPLLDSIFAVDAQAKAYYSSNNGTSWLLKNASYTPTNPGGTQDIFSDGSSLYIIKGTDREIWRSNNLGVTWSMINDSFSNKDLYEGTSDSNSIYVFVGAGASYRSTNKGINWTAITDFNGGAANNPAGATVNSTGAVFVVDNAGKVYYSTNSGQNWTNTNGGYGRTTDTQEMFADSYDNLYIIAQTSKEVWRSNNSGVNWSVVNDSFAGGSGIFGGIGDHQGNIFALTGQSTNAVYKSINKGISWSLVNGSYNGGNGAVRGMVSMYLKTNLTLQVKNCSLANCSNASFVGPDGTSGSFYNTNNSSYIINRTGRYFQYKTYFTSQDSAVSPKLYNLSLNYNILDNQPPSIVIYSPINQSYGTDSVFLNYSASDSSGIDKCWRSLDNGANSTPGLCTTTIISGLADGIHSIKVYANDSLGNYNYSEIYFSIDNSYPTFSGVSESTPSYYNPGINSSFNISWNDPNLGSVWFESNFSGIVKNYSMNPSGGGLYVFSTILPAGIFYWKAFANDSFGRINITSAREFSVGRAEPSINLTLNEIENNISLTYGASVNVSSICAQGFVYLYRNGEVMANPELITLGVGNYNYTAFFNGNQNYTAGSKTMYLNIDKAAPNVQLLINGFDSDVSASAFTNVIINSSLISPMDGEGYLYENELFNSSGTAFNLMVNYSVLGDYVWKVNYSGNQNYTAGSKSHTLRIIDQNSPSYSGGLIASYPSPVSYWPSRVYQFNSTWTDNIGIDEVIFEFNGINYTHSSAQVGKNGNEYYAYVYDLPAGVYPYRWYANDTSSNLVSTPLQSYNVTKSTPTLHYEISPSNSVSYGTAIALECKVDNLQSILVITRNGVPVSNPDESSLTPGIYEYLCSSVDSQNYSFANTLKTYLTVGKANPVINLTLNGQAGDLSFAGGDVNISASLIYPVSGIINLTFDGQTVSGASPLLNTTTITGAGVHYVSAYFGGSDNYSYGSVGRVVTVTSVASSPGATSGNGGGGVSSAGSATTSLNNNYDVEFSNLGDIIVSPGEYRTLELSVKNTGKKFLNKCKLGGKDSYSSWIDSKDVKNINSGEITSYIFGLSIPITATSLDNLTLSLDCLEETVDLPLNLFLLDSGMNLKIAGITLLSKDELEVSFEFSGNKEFGQPLTFKVYSSTQKVLDQMNQTILIERDKKENKIRLNVSGADEGMLKVAITKAGENKSIVEEFFVYNKAKSTTGFALFNSLTSPLAPIIFFIVLFAILAFVLMKRIFLLKRMDDKYIEINLKNIKAKDDRAVLNIKVVKDSKDVDEVINSLREGFIIILDVGEVRKKDSEKLKKFVAKIKRTTDAIGGDIAGFGNDIIIATPRFAKIHR